MSRPAAWFLFLIVTATTSHAAWSPLYNPSHIRVRPGETVLVTVTAAWTSGVSYFPFSPMTLVSNDPDIATVEGTLLTTQPTQVRITGHRRGRTGAHFVQFGTRYDRYSPVIVVADETLPVTIAVDGVATVGSTITLRALSDEPDATFFWFQGRLDGGFQQEAGAGPEITFTPRVAGIYEYWVQIASPRGAGAASIRIEVTNSPARRRAVRH